MQTHMRPHRTNRGEGRVQRVWHGTSVLPLPPRHHTPAQLASSTAWGPTRHWKGCRQGPGIAGGPVPPAATAAAAAAAPDAAPERLGVQLAASLHRYRTALTGLWSSFLPMISLFFMLSFINTLLDALKDTLVITATGGGAQVIPFLSVYAVLPSSLLFLLAYSVASQHMHRQALFNAIVVTFAAFFIGFTLFLYPNTAALHPHTLADQLEVWMPQGLAGAVGMLRNWTYTLFFVAAELFGDVCLGLLFWGLANDTTALEHAPMLYPLFGLGANVAQALAGVVLKGTTMMSTGAGFGAEINVSMAIVVAMCAGVVLLHNHISTNVASATAAASAAFQQQGQQRQRQQQRQHQQEDRAAAHAAGGTTSVASQLVSAATAGHLNGNGNGRAAVAAAPANGSGAAPADGLSTSQAGSRDAGTGAGSSDAAQPEARQPKSKRSLGEIARALAGSPEIRFLAIMSLAQGLCTTLVEFAFKAHVALLYPSPSDFTAFSGDVALLTGVVTAVLMLVSPVFFQLLGWRGVANATPKLLLFGGSAFFVACIAYQQLYGAATAGGCATAAAAGGPLLQFVVMSGAVLFILCKGLKFSTFKPAEEMVYITMDEESKTKGKAAIDVVGAQTGKSGGSMLQQLLLLLSGGAIHSILPAMLLVFVAMLRSWSGAVNSLADAKDYFLSGATRGSMDAPGPSATATLAAGATPLAPAQPPSAEQLDGSAAEALPLQGVAAAASAAA